ncbi:MAG: prepilin peptidase, partial [Actinobacteria bacterium]|nr:prepilin peptidase [Actinomycetota bacterium]
MSSSPLLTAGLGAVVGLALTPYAARITVSAPDRERADWWRGGRPGARRLTVTGGLLVAFAALAGYAAGWSALLPAYLVLAGGCGPLAVIDFELHRLPNRLLLPTAALCGALLTLAALVRSEWGPWLRGVEAAAVVFALFYLIALFAPFGYGDVKLGALLAGFL